MKTDPKEIVMPWRERIRRLAWVGVVALVATVSLYVGIVWWNLPRGEMPAIVDRMTDVPATPEFDGLRRRMASLCAGVYDDGPRYDAFVEAETEIWEGTYRYETASFHLTDVEKEEIRSLLTEFQNQALPEVPRGHFFTMPDRCGFVHLAEHVILVEDLAPDEACMALSAVMNICDTGKSKTQSDRIYRPIGVMVIQRTLAWRHQLLDADPALLEALRDKVWLSADHQQYTNGLRDDLVLLAEGIRRKQDETVMGAVLGMVNGDCLARYAERCDAELRAGRLLELTAWLAEQGSMLNPCAEYRRLLLTSLNMELENRAAAGMVATVLSGALDPEGVEAYLKAAMVEGIEYRRDPFALDGGNFLVDTVGGKIRVRSRGVLPESVDWEPDPIELILAP